MPYNFTLAPIAGLWIYSPSKQGTPDIVRGVMPGCRCPETIEFSSSSC